MILAVLLALAANAAETSSVLETDVGDGRHIALHCAGTGGPTVILTAGLGESAETWSNIQPTVAKIARTCAWDRAGNGQSDPSTEPQDAAHTTADLETALAAAKIEGPYVLVGHSLGSFESLLFAFRHSDLVRALVLVDPSSPNQNRIFAEASPTFGKYSKRRLAERNIALKNCIAALETKALVDANKVCDGDGGGAAVQSRIGKAQSVVSLAENIDASSAQLEAARHRLGSIPIIVLTAGKGFSLPADLAGESPKVFKAWSKMHDDLAALSDKGENRTIEGAGHYIHLDRPAAVVEAIRQVAEEVRRLPVSR